MTADPTHDPRKMRLAEALRANLKRRRAQTKLREAKNRPEQPDFAAKPPQAERKSGPASG